MFFKCANLEYTAINISVNINVNQISRTINFRVCPNILIFSD